MDALYRLNAVVKNYDWGSDTLIPDICNLPIGKPVAELWMGVYPSGMSKLESAQSLKSFLAKAPPSFLSLKEDKKQMDFLFKVLGVQKATSIQIHPTSEQAIFGFQDEDARGLLLNAPNRNYKDKSHKAEMLFALTDFWVLMGILPAQEIAKNLAGIAIPFWEKWHATFLGESTKESIKQFCYELYTYEDVEGLVSKSLPFLLNREGDLAWIAHLYNDFGVDIGIFSPLWMNVVNLSRGEALFIKETCIHAHLKGLAMGLMTNSDNIIRSSLTEKFKDITEFMRLANFELMHVQKLESSWQGKSTQVFSPEGVDFSLQQVDFQESLEVEIPCPYARIGFALGNIDLTLEGSQLALKKGDSILIKASSQNLFIKGEDKDASLLIATWQN